MLTPSGVESAKMRAASAITAVADQLDALALQLWHHPELSHCETGSVQAVTQLAESVGFFCTTTSSSGIPTGFVGRSRRFASRTVADHVPVVAVIAEYDALPHIGHGCGHNLIAAGAVGVAHALDVAVGDTVDVRLIGTPGEETCTGKQLMADAGIFDDIDVAILTHPGPFEAATTTFFGRALLAAQCPPMTSANSSLATAADFIEAILAVPLEGCTVSARLDVSEGTPHYVGAGITYKASFELRGHSVGGLALAKARLVSAVPTHPPNGVELALHQTSYTPPYRADSVILGNWIHNRRSQGIKPAVELHPPGTAIVTDLSTLPKTVRTIHPVYDIGSYPAINHTAGFADACRSECALTAMRSASVCSAWTILDTLGAMQTTTYEQLGARCSMQK